MFIITIIVMYILFVDVFMYMNVYVYECSRVFYAEVACHLYLRPLRRVSRAEKQV